MTQRCTLLVLLGLTIGLTADARASTIFDNGGPDLVTAWNSDLTTFGFESADNFDLLAGSSTITDIHWFGEYFDNIAGTDAFTIRIYDDAGGEPDTLVYSNFIGSSATRTPTGTQGSGGFDVYAYSMLVAPIALSSGTPYWLSIVNDTTNGWYWATSVGFSSGDSVIREGPTGAWEPTPLGNELAFSLTNDVPEPMTLMLVGTGVVAALARRRSRRATRA